MEKNSPVILWYYLRWLKAPIHGNAGEWKTQQTLGHRLIRILIFLVGNILHMDAFLGRYDFDETLEIGLCENHYNLRKRNLSISICLCCAAILIGASSIYWSLKSLLSLSLWVMMAGLFYAFKARLRVRVESTYDGFLIISGLSSAFLESLPPFDRK